MGRGKEFHRKVAKIAKHLVGREARVFEGFAPVNLAAIFPFSGVKPAVGFAPYKSHCQRPLETTNDLTIHRFIWQPNRVDWQSYYPSSLSVTS